MELVTMNVTFEKCNRELRLTGLIHKSKRKYKCAMDLLT